jgi:hypothetical protein
LNDQLKYATSDRELWFIRPTRAHPAMARTLTPQFSA